MKRKCKDLTGQKFGRLTAIGIEDRGTRKTYWICKCDCGNIKIVRSDSLQNGTIRSCGCLKKEQDSKNLGRTTHNMSHTRIHLIWSSMKGRCNNPNDARYDNYGGRGIKVCEEWENDFVAFYNWAISNGYNDNLTIDRINNDLWYSPNNCRWTDAKTQARNRTTNINITIGNSTRTLTEWCEIFDLDFKTIVARYNRNKILTLDELFKPIKK